MKYQQLNKSDISNGPGVRVSLFVSGCTLRCKGCHNPEAWNFESGTEFTNETIDLILEQVGKSYIQGLSILGGEPYDQKDFPMLVKLVRRFKFFYPEKNIWIWTGYEFDQIKSSPLTKFVDVAVTGRFILEQRDISDANRWRGSTNQRVIDVQASLNSGKVIGLSGIPNNEV